MNKNSLRKTMRANGAAIIAIWTAFMLLLGGSTLYSQHLGTLKDAENEARDYFKLNQVYRTWAARVGGLYAPVQKVAPNKYLHSSKRDLTTTDGQKLTLINPAYMTRMVFEHGKSSSNNPVISKITSLNPLNPGNLADDWERQALLDFRDGTTERAQLALIDGKPYLRYIGRFVTEESCLNCHAAQGFKLGDVRGGITISVPLAGYFAAERKTGHHLLGGYLLLWLVGSGGIAFSSRRRSAYEDELRAGEEKFRTVCDWTQDWEYWIDEHGAMRYVSPSCLELTGYTPEEIVYQPSLVRSMLHPEDRELFEKHCSIPSEDDLQGAEPLEFRIVTKDGVERWMHHACRPVFHDGQYRGNRASNRDVTERKLAERELAIRAELLNSVSDSVLVMDREGNIMDANETAWRSRGLSKEELLSMSLAQLSSAGQAEACGGLIAQVFQQGWACLEMEHRVKSDGVISVEVNARIIDYREEPAALACIRDITQRKQTEDSLRRSERLNASLNRISAFLTSRSDREMYDELLATLLDIMGSSIGLAGYLEANGDLVCPSSAGWSDHDGQGSDRIFPAESWGDTLCGKALSTGKPLYSNLPQQTPACDMPIKRSMAVPLLSEGRTIGLLMVANRDRDYQDDDLEMLNAIGVQVAPVLQARLRQHQATAALKENENKLGVIFDVIQAGILQVDETGVVVFANQRMAEMFGMELDELLGSSYRSHVCADQLQSCDSNLGQLLEGSVEYVHLERRYLRKDGSSFWGYLSGRRLNGKDQSHPMLVGTISDMTELKSAEEKRHRSEQQMLHVQKLESLGVLAGGIAHDFNNILLAIMGNASLALHRITPESPALQHLEQIEKAAQKAADLARQMLAYSGKGRFVLEALDLNRLVRDMGSMLEISISKKAELRFHLTQQLPAIVADPTQIRQIVMNLAINASEAIGERSGVISIATGCRNCDRSYLEETWLNDDLAEGPYVFIEVADNGCGMEAKTVERIFEPFFTTKFTGRGLGMAAILGIVRGHKGAIKVYTEPGKGSTFRVYFPASEKPAEASRAPGADKRWRGEGTVLLVDDEETVRTVGTEMLTELGFKVLQANDGKEALQLYQSKQEQIALVLMDLNMPRLNGEEAFHEMRRIDAQVRVILSSGFSEQEVTQKFLGQGLAGFVQKPYSLDTLRDALSRLL
jgi:PAS domain S-box-containing protein